MAIRNGARIWLPDHEHVWRAVAVDEDYTGSGKLVVLGENGKQETITIKSNSDLPPLRNPDILIGHTDLTTLSYLNEPEVLYNLESRFNKSQIYTKCGIVLVAINPYKNLNIYESDTIELYREQDVQMLEPHIFAVAELAYQSMVNFNKNQSIIVSGESGAGKTVSAKYAMRYFANIAGLSEETQIEKKVLASNPIMEAIGNAKTIRNDNSSRFGKYIELGFFKNHICGASMKTYLLEKSRVIYQASDERNYHIFYQLCTQHENQDMKTLSLLSADQFRYTENAIIIKGVNDALMFNDTREALFLLGIDSKTQMLLFRLLSAILHLGNVEITEAEREATYIKYPNESFSTFCSLLKIDENRMKTWLCSKKLKAGIEVCIMPLNLQQSLFARDALAKHMYSQLFRWLVEEINKSLEYIRDKQSFIGVLDIYGFETFEMNSFEQFCINYANEKLQQQFCQHVFKLEQEEYMKEEITWSFIQFQDNQPCIDLIENKLGILDLLDEECIVPKGSDENWLRKLINQHGKHDDFLTNKLSSSTFIINHFAEKVEYSINGFLEKNRDTVLEDQLTVLKESELDFVVQLFSDDDDIPVTAQNINKNHTIQNADTLHSNSKAQATRKKTVSFQFRESLKSLMLALNSTEPHYVRCIKPNDSKAPFTFESRRAVQQLRACGVLETVRISAAGYPSRWTYQDFFQRYRLLAKSSMIDRTNYRKTCENILKTLIQDPDKFQFGNTKIFFRAGQVAYLEKLRSEKLKMCIIRIQTTYRGYRQRKKYLIIRKTILKLQMLTRGYLARGHAELVRRARAITLFQSKWRMQMQKRIYEKLKMTIVKLQAYSRGYLVRCNIQRRVIERRVVTIQSRIRMWLYKRRFDTIKRGILLLQTYQRRQEAVDTVKKIKAELRSVEHQRKLNQGLENKIISLQQRNDEQKRETERLLSKENGLELLRKEFDQLKLINKDLKQNIKQQITIEEENNQLRAEIERLGTENQIIRTEHQQLKVSKEELIVKHTESLATLKFALDAKTSDIKRLEEQIQDTNTTDQLKRLKELEDELQTERQQRQRYIIEMHRLEQKCENLESELQVTDLKHRNEPHVQGSMKRSLSDADMTIYLSSALNLEQGHDGEPQASNKNNLSEGDGGLLLRLQRRLQQSETVNKALADELDKATKSDGDRDRYLLATSGSISVNKTTATDKAHSWHLNEVEMERLKNDLKSLTELILKGDKTSAREQLLGQFDALNAELEHHRKSQVQIKSMLEDHVLMYDVSEVNLDNTDPIGEAYKSQKQINKMLELELEQSRTSYQREYLRIQERLQQIENENIELCKTIAENTVDDMMKQQITNVITENLELRDTLYNSQLEIRKLRRTIKLINKTFSESNLSVENTLTAGAVADSDKFLNDQLLPNNQSNNTTVVSNNPYDNPYDLNGMIKCTPQHTEKITDTLILNLKPRLAATFLPGLPAYILFMCIRYIDFIDDEGFVAVFLSSVTKKIQKLPR
ncbi:unnamed protein product, partial [Didymodactylos carnosus]